MKHVAILLAALVLVLGAHAVTRAEPPAAAPVAALRWEYDTLGVSKSLDPYQLSKMGKDGWEAVAAVAAERTVGIEDGFIVLFKRPAK